MSEKQLVEKYKETFNLDLFFDNVNIGEGYYVQEPTDKSESRPSKFVGFDLDGARRTYEDMIELKQKIQKEKTKENTCIIREGAYKPTRDDSFTVVNY